MRGDLMKLLSNEWHAKSTEQSPSPVLCTLSLRVGDEMYVHSIALRVRIEVDFDLWK